MPRIASGLLLLLSLTASSLLGAQTETVNNIPDALRARIDSAAQQVLKSTGVPSASVAVVQHGQIVYTQAYGDARLQPSTLATPRDALLHRIDLEAVHSRGHPVTTAAGQAFHR